MKKYRVIARTIVFKEVGVFEAESEQEAIVMAFDEGDTDLNLCYHCSKDVGDVEIESLVAQEEE